MQVKAQSLQFAHDFLQRLFAEIANLHHLFGRFVDQIAYRIDAGTLQTIESANRKVKLFNGHLKNLILTGFFLLFHNLGGIHFVTQFHKVIELSIEDLGSQADVDGRWYPEFFRINFSRCIFCGLCEEACPTTAIQLTPDFELGEYKRQDLVYEKEDLLISGPGKYPEYNVKLAYKLDKNWAPYGEEMK